MAGLLGKPNAGTSSYSSTAGGYWPAAEFNVYRYYNKTMTGNRIATDPTQDLQGEVYAVVDSDRVRLLVGTRVPTGTWYINLSSLSSISLPTSGTLNIHTYRFNGSSNHFQEYDYPVDLRVYEHLYSSNQLPFPIYTTETYSALAFKFSRTSGATI